MIMRQLVVRPLSAELTRDTELISKMDPYCVITWGTEKHTTQVRDEAGKNPRWSDSFFFIIPHNLSVMHVQVFDKDVITKDDLVGEGTIDVSHILNSNGAPINEIVHLLHKGKSAGKAFISFQVREVVSPNQGFAPEHGHHGHHHPPGHNCGN